MSPLRLDGFLGAFDAWARPFRRRRGFSLRPGGPVPSLYGLVDQVLLRFALGGPWAASLQEEADAWAAAIGAFCAADGRFIEHETWHLWEHATAYAVAGLALLGRRPGRPLAALAALDTKAALLRWLRRCNWELVWPGSHQIGGLAAVAAVEGPPTPDWFDWYFDLLDRRVDPRTGFWARGLVHRIKPAGVHEMAGAVHMYWVYHHQGRPLLCPGRIVDATLALQRPGGLFGAPPAFCRELDGVWTLIHASDQAGGYRASEVRAACRRCLEAVVAVLNDPELLRRRYLSSHRLVGALQSVAAVQGRYPELLDTPVPLRCVVDRVPWM